MSFLGSVSASLTATSGDILTATYVDPLDDFGNEVTSDDEAYYNVTLLSGSYTGNVTWSASSSPFLVTGDVTIGSEQSTGSLTIDPGVEVRFLSIMDDQSSGQDGNRSEIIVYGSLSAVGTSSDSIVFKSLGVLLVLEIGIVFRFEVIIREILKCHIVVLRI